MMNKNKQKIKNCFNKSFLTYDQYSQVQELIGEKIINSIGTLRKFKNIIDLGCGTGMTTEKLAKNFKYQNFYAIDIAEKLLLKSKERLKNYSIKITESDFEDFCYSPISFDLIFSNMALQWSLNIKKTLLNIYHQLNNSGLFVFSMPIKDTFLELKNYNKNKFYNKKSIINFLNNSGFKKTYFFSKKISLKFNSLLEALRHIKAMGANCVLNNKTLPFSKQKIHEKFILTYHIGFFIASKN